MINKTKMDDSRLLQLAADSVGLHYIQPTEDYTGNLGLALCDQWGMPTEDWDPLQYNRDAFKLAVDLDMEVNRNSMKVKVFVQTKAKPLCIVVDIEEGANTHEKTRRAIVRAAAKSRVMYNTLYGKEEKEEV